jgi:hypothetical protein
MLCYTRARFAAVHPGVESDLDSTMLGVSRNMPIYLLLACTLLPATLVHSQQTPSKMADAIAVVTLLPKNASTPTALVSKDDVLVFEGQSRKEIVTLLPARDDHAVLQLAIVIDDALSKRFAGQLDGLRKFILALPDTTSVGLYYAQSGSLQVAAQINPDHQAAAKALHPPASTYGNYVSSYNAVLQLIASWPPSQARREILLFTEGFDMLHHEYVDHEMESVVAQAQKSGILIHTIFANSVRPFLGGANPGNDDRPMRGVDTLGRSNLFQLADETGGVPSQGDTWNATSVGPVLNQLRRALDNQYFLVWATNPSTHADGELRSFKLKVENDKIRIIAPHKVFVPQ